MLGLYGLQRLQGSLPLNPTDAVGVPPALAFNTAVSFVTNTNWQNYGGELTMSHLTQMAGLAVQNFLSAAVGLSVAIALVRGLVRRRSATIGNFWVDLTRSVTRVLLPLSIVVALILVSQGVVQNLHGFTDATTVSGATQTIPGGPIASQEAIKELGTNGGGPYNANSAHPFENPTGFTNLLADPGAALHPVRADVHLRPAGQGPEAGLGRLRGDVRDLDRGDRSRDGVRGAGQPAARGAGSDRRELEGKETRFGIATSGLYAASTTGTSTGAVNSAHDSYTPLGGAVPLVHMMLGEVSPGGVGAGLYGMLVFALLAVFLAGLMVGRTPEYVGKKIQATEMKLVVVYLAVVPIVILAFAGHLGRARHGDRIDPQPRPSRALRGRLRVHVGGEQQRLGVRRAHGQHRLVQHDPRSRDGCSAASCLIVAVLAIAGSLARKQSTPVTAGTFPTGTPLFAGLLTVVVLAVVGLTYFPVVSLGPVLEQLGL